MAYLVCGVMNENRREKIGKGNVDPWWWGFGLYLAIWVRRKITLLGPKIGVQKSVFGGAR